MKLAVYDLLGREAAILVNEELKAGNYTVEWDASSFASGVYFYRFEAGEISGSSTGKFIKTMKMVLVK